MLNQVVGRKRTDQQYSQQRSDAGPVSLALLIDGEVTGAFGRLAAIGDRLALVALGLGALALFLILGLLVGHALLFTALGNRRHIPSYVAPGQTDRPNPDAQLN